MQAVIVWEELNTAKDMQTLVNAKNVWDHFYWLTKDVKSQIANNIGMKAVLCAENHLSLRIDSVHYHTVSYMMKLGLNVGIVKINTIYKIHYVYKMILIV